MSVSDAIRALYAAEPKVSVIAYSGLTVDACEAEGARWMLRGVRSVADFEYERNLADINRRISGIETLLLFTLPEYAAISSSVVRELQAYGRDVSEFPARRGPESHDRTSTHARDISIQNKHHIYTDFTD